MYRNNKELTVHIATYIFTYRMHLVILEKKNFFLIIERWGQWSSSRFSRFARSDRRDPSVFRICQGRVFHGHVSVLRPLCSSPAQTHSR